MRVLYNETKIFKTRERVPFLAFFETISRADSMNLEAKWERDFDYLRWQCNLVNINNNNDSLNNAMEDVEVPRLVERRNFENLRQYLAAEKKNLSNSVTPVLNAPINVRPRRNRNVYSKSEEIRRRRRKNVDKNKANDAMYMKNKLSKMTEKEIMNRMNFMLQLLKYSESKGIKKLNIEYLEKLKNMLSVLEMKKNRTTTINTATINDISVRLEQIRKNSPFEAFPSYKIRGYIIKAGDDMRQESLIIHFINSVRNILLRENCQVYIKELDFIILSKTSALIEWVPNTASVDSLKKLYKEKSLYDIYKTMFIGQFEEAQKNFVESLAGYCFICYILQIKDRHNGNILIDNQGHIIHIDFGFCLNAVPGNVTFETAPFKFTKEYLDILGGFDSTMFYYFKILLYKAFDIFKKFSEEFWSLIEIMQGASIPCFYKFDMATLKERFHRFVSDTEREKLVHNLIMYSFNSTRTTLYDHFQKYSNDIEM